MTASLRSVDIFGRWESLTFRVASGDGFQHVATAAGAFSRRVLGFGSRAFIMKQTLLSPAAGVILAFSGCGGWSVVRAASPVALENEVAVDAVPVAGMARQGAAHAVYQGEFRDELTVEMFASGKKDEVILRFPTDESYQAFFGGILSWDVEVVAGVERLRAVRLRYERWGEVMALLDGMQLAVCQVKQVRPVSDLLGKGTQQGLVEFGDSLMEWLGIREDHSTWGEGVRIAVIDFGVLPHIGLRAVVGSILPEQSVADLNPVSGHGTAVASLIAGIHPSARGVAPAAELISIQVGDGSGVVDSLALADGILVALDAGVDLINISMGIVEDNPLIQDAVVMAQRAGVVIVAASGNCGRGKALYPAAYPGVIGVGAVDARGGHLDFSNRSDSLAISAPGYGVSVAWMGDQFKSFDGTSLSAPIVTGAIAATMSSGSGVTMTAREAAQIVLQNANEAGHPGPDAEYGFGILNLARVMNRGRSGIVDAAITDQRLVIGAGGGGVGELWVTVQNRGTAVLINTLVEVRTPFGMWQFNEMMLPAGAVRTFSIPVRVSGLEQGGEIFVSSALKLGMLGQDSTPSNNYREDLLEIP